MELYDIQHSYTGSNSDAFHNKIFFDTQTSLRFILKLYLALKKQKEDEIKHKRGLHPAVFFTMPNKTEKKKREKLREKVLV